MDAAGYAAHGLLDGVGADGVEARTRLLDGLVEAGVDLDELREAARRGRLPLLPLEQALATRGPRRTTRQASEELGLSLELMTAMRRSLGLPEVGLDEPALDDADLEAVGRARAAIRAGVPETRVLEMTKLLRSSMSLVADVLYRTMAEGLVDEPDEEDEQALLLVRASETLVPILSPVLDYALTQHLRERVARDFVQGRGAALGVDAEQCVGFADVVGWTARSASVGLPEVAGLADTLTQTTLDHLVGRARLVKVLGDAVMVTAPTTTEVVESLRGLTTDLAGRGLPPVRCGVATGPVAHVQGDVYGPPVDLASRLTDLAAPGSIWLPAYAAAALSDPAGTHDEGVHRVKGLPDDLAVCSVTA